MLPNYMIIGAGRSATTWLHDCLHAHPDVFTPEQKELHFFSTHYDKGISWYSSFFAQAKEHPAKAVGEASPSYLPDEHCPGRIAEHVPDVKMIAILRNPVDRAFSQYLHLNWSYKCRTFEDAIKKFPSILEEGLYDRHIRNYRQYFSEKQMLVLNYGDIRRDSRAFLNTVYRFLDITPDILPDSMNKQTNLVVYPELTRFLERMRLGWVISLVKKTFLDTMIREMSRMRKGKSYPAMKPETREYVTRYYQDTVRRTSELTGWDLSAWH